MTELALDIQGLDVAIAGTPILRKVTLQLPQGSMAGLIGRNGAGKTTLMRAVMGLLPSRSATLACAGESMAQLPAHTRAEHGISYLPEDRRLIPSLTVEENILLCLLYTSPSPRDS